MKKRYIQPEVQTYQVTTSQVFCGSGQYNANLYGGENSGWNNGDFISGDAAEHRGGWEDYEK